MELELDDIGKMQQDIRSWGMWSLALGAGHILASGFLNAPWGVVLILVGLASFYFRTASMFIIYSVTLGGAGLFNLLGGTGGWGVLAVVQLVLAVSTFRQYGRYRKMQAELAQPQLKEAGYDSPPTEPAARWFPWIGPFLGCSSALGLVFAFVIGIVLAISGQIDTLPDAVAQLLDEIIMGLGVLGAGVCLASLLSGYRPRALAIIGLIAAGLTLAVIVALYLAA